MISKNEHGIVDYYNNSGELVGLMTANQLETVFFFYEYDGKDYKKLGRGDNPLELERRFRVKERMGVKK